MYLNELLKMNVYNNYSASVCVWMYKHIQYTSTLYEVYYCLRWVVLYV
jgi:hypothetical protein